MPTTPQQRQRALRSLPVVRQQVIPLTGGLDLETPDWLAKPGTVRDAKNFECLSTEGGGYRVVRGYRQFDGRQGPGTQPRRIVQMHVPMADVGRWVVGATLRVRNYDDGVLYMIAEIPNALYTIDRATGAATLVGPLSISGPRGIEWDGTRLLVADHFTDNIYNVNIDAATSTVVGDTGLIEMQSLLWDDENLFTAENHTNALYTLNPQTAAPTLVGRFNGPTNVRGMAWDGETMFAGDRPTHSLYTIDRATGAATLVGRDPNIDIEYDGLTWDGTRLLCPSNHNDSLYTIDRATAAATLVGPLNVNDPEGLAFTWAYADIGTITFVRRLDDADTTTAALLVALTDIDPRYDLARGAHRVILRGPQ